MTVTCKEELGRQIRNARMGAGMSQENLAMKMSVSRPQLSNYENGKSDVPARIAAEIAEALGVYFIVGGCRIGPNFTKLSQPSIEAHQLCLEFDTEHHFPSSAVTIKPTRDSIVITATIRRVG
jgi:transcriptional regulator with XRE-family HTH domain